MKVMASSTSSHLISLFSSPNGTTGLLALFVIGRSRTLHARMDGNRGMGTRRPEKLGVRFEAAVYRCQCLAWSSAIAREHLGALVSILFFPDFSWQDIACTTRMAWLSYPMIFLLYMYFHCYAPSLGDCH